MVFREARSKSSAVASRGVCCNCPNAENDVGLTWALGSLAALGLRERSNIFSVAIIFFTLYSPCPRSYSCLHDARLRKLSIYDFEIGLSSLVDFVSSSALKQFHVKCRLRIISQKVFLIEQRKSSRRQTEKRSSWMPNPPFPARNMGTLHCIALRMGEM
jgi:hypothetical protein